MRNPLRRPFPLHRTSEKIPMFMPVLDSKGHNGPDIGNPTDTNIIAPIAGKIIEVGWDKGYGFI